MTSTLTPPVVTVIVCGEIDVATKEPLRDALTAALTRGTNLEADLSAVTFMDASGIGVLIAAQLDAAASGGSLTLRNPSRAVRLLTGILGLDKILPAVE